MAFKLKSGNKTNFKNMGSSPAKQKERKNWENYGKGEGADIVKKSGLGPRETSGYTDLEDKTPGQLMEFDLGGIMKKYATKKRADKKVKTAYDTLKSKKKSPAKQKKTYPKSYTKKDIAFLKEQKEDVVRREDLDEKGKAIYDANQAKKKKNKKKTKTREDYLNEGFSQVEADQMVKEGGVTGYDTQEEINKGRGRKVKKKTPAKQKTKILTDSQRRAQHEAFKKRAAEANKKQKTKDYIGEGFMRPPYKDTVHGTRPYAKRQGYHGYKDFDSIIEQKEDAQGKDTNIKTRKVMKDGSKNRVHYHKKTKK